MNQKNKPYNNPNTSPYIEPNIYLIGQLPIKNLKNKDLKEKIFSKYRKNDWQLKTIEEISTQIILGKKITKDQLGKGSYPAVKCGDTQKQP